MNPEICIIAALASENRVIGVRGQIPWHISADLKRFKALTTPHPIVMGRKTFESIRKPLPNRVNIVVSKTGLFEGQTLRTVRTFEEGLMIGRILDKERVFVIGGGEIYRQAIQGADRLFLTLVEGDFEGDTFFPDYSDFGNVISEEPGEENGIRYRFVELER